MTMEVVQSIGEMFVVTNWSFSSSESVGDYIITIKVVNYTIEALMSHLRIVILSARCQDR